jgi:hypothetical protein
MALEVWVVLLEPIGEASDYLFALSIVGELVIILTEQLGYVSVVALLIKHQCSPVMLRSLIPLGDTSGTSDALGYIIDRPSLSWPTGCG